MTVTTNLAKMGLCLAHVPSGRYHHETIGILRVLLAVVGSFAGCSQETKQRAGKALNQTGEAIESAAKDASAVTKGAIEGAKDAIDKTQAEPSTEPAK